MQQSPDRRDEYIMLCLDHAHPPLTTLHQIKLSLSTKPSNASLSQRLAWEYESQREPFTLLTFTFRPFWREVKAIHFVRFMTLGPQPVMTAQIEEMHALPHELHTWVWNRKHGINASIMAMFLREPDSVGEDWCVYDWIPKSRSPLPPKDGLDGWGLYMEEHVSREGKVWCVNILFMITCLLEALGLTQTKEIFGIIVISINVYSVGSIVAAASASVSD